MLDVHAISLLLESELSFTLTEGSGEGGTKKLITGGARLEIVPDTIKLSQCALVVASP